MGGAHWAASCFSIHELDTECTPDTYGVPGAKILYLAEQQSSEIPKPPPPDTKRPALLQSGAQRRGLPSADQPSGARIAINASSRNHGVMPM
jgi:hypothetical protein